MRQQFNLKSYLPFESTANITDKNLKGRMSAFISYKKRQKKVRNLLRFLNVVSLKNQNLQFKASPCLPCFH